MSYNARQNDFPQIIMDARTLRVASHGNTRQAPHNSTRFQILPPGSSPLTIILPANSRHPDSSLALALIQTKDQPLRCHCTGFSGTSEDDQRQGPPSALTIVFADERRHDSQLTQRHSNITRASPKNVKRMHTPQ